MTAAEKSGPELCGRRERGEGEEESSVPAQEGLCCCNCRVCQQPLGMLTFPRNLLRFAGSPLACSALKETGGAWAEAAGGRCRLDMRWTERGKAAEALTAGWVAHLFRAAACKVLLLQRRAGPLPTPAERRPLLALVLLQRHSAALQDPPPPPPRLRNPPLRFPTSGLQSRGEAEALGFGVSTRRRKLAPCGYARLSF